MHYFGNKV